MSKKLEDFLKKFDIELKNYDYFEGAITDIAKKIAIFEINNYFKNNLDLFNFIKTQKNQKELNSLKQEIKEYFN